MLQLRAHENIISTQQQRSHCPLNDQKSARQSKMLVDLQFPSTENGNKCMCDTTTKLHIHATGFVKEFDSMLGCNLQLDATDQIITIGNDLNPMSSITMTTDIYSKMKHNYNSIGRIAIGLDVYDIFTVTTYIFNILIKSSISVSFSDVLTIFFIRMNLQLDKLMEFKYNCCNTTSITIIETFNILSDGTLTATFWLAAIDLMVQVMNTLPSTITVSIELDTHIVSIDQLVLHLDIYLSNDAVCLYTQVIHYVCAVFSFFVHLHF